MTKEKRFDNFFEKAFWTMTAFISAAGITIGGLWGKQFVRLNDQVRQANETMIGFAAKIQSSDENQNRRLERVEDDVKDLQRKPRH